MRLNALRTVLFPHPEGPIKADIFCFGIRRLTSCTARKSSVEHIRDFCLDGRSEFEFLCFVECLIGVLSIKMNAEVLLPPPAEAVSEEYRGSHLRLIGKPVIQ